MANIHSLADVASRELTAFGRGEERHLGLPSGIGLEEFVPGGIPRDKVTIIFGNVGSFKTTIAAHVLMSIAAAGYPALLVSFEDSAALVAARWLSQQSGVPYGLLAGGCVLDDEQQDRLESARAHLAQVSSVFITDNLEASFDRVIEAVRRIPGCAAVVVDYIQLLTDKASEKESIDAAVKKAQAAAKALNCAFILISQQKIDREDHVKNPRPQLRDLFGSSAMRMGAKLI